jgi:hypothetical protein
MESKVIVNKKELINRIKAVRSFVNATLGYVKQVSDDANLNELLGSIDECLVIMKEYVEDGSLG